ncbi:MAG: NAD(P)H-hydrate epimerase, partial [Bauldia sp.]
MTKNTPVDAQWAQRFASLLDDEPSDVPASGGQIPVLTDPLEVLTPQEMARADQLAISAGTSGHALMERAGQAVADAVSRLAPPGARIAIMTGPGNNGGDGFVAARLLAEAGYLVNVGLLVARDRLKGDAAFAAASWTGFSKGLSPTMAAEADVVVDALFGAGLDRPIEGTAAQAIDAVNKSDVPVVAVDL